MDIFRRVSRVRKNPDSSHPLNLVWNRDQNIDRRVQRVLHAFHVQQLHLFPTLESDQHLLQC